MFQRILPRAIRSVRPATRYVFPQVKNANGSKRKFHSFLNYLRGTRKNVPNGANAQSARNSKIAINQQTRKKLANQKVLREQLNQLTTRNATKFLLSTPAQGLAIPYAGYQMKAYQALGGLRWLALTQQRLLASAFTTQGILSVPNFVSFNQAIYSQEFQENFAYNQIMFKKNTGGVYGIYSDNFFDIPKDVDRQLRSNKPKGIKTDRDHIVPRSFYAIKTLIQTVSSIEYDPEIMYNLKENELDNYLIERVNVSLPSLEEMYQIIYTGNSKPNMRILSSAEHDKYTFLERQEFNQKTKAPYTMFEKAKVLVTEERGLPKEIIGYKKGVVDTKNYTIEDVLTPFISVNDELCDAIPVEGKPFLQKFVPNMKSFVRRAVGLPKTKIFVGGASNKINEYLLYDYLVYVFGNIPKKEEEDNNVHSEDHTVETIELLRTLSIQIFKHLILQNKLLNMYKKKI